MLSFKAIPILLKIATDQMEVTRLDNGQRAAGAPAAPFSNTRLVVAHFPCAEDHLKLLLRKVVGGGVLTPKLHIVVQQLERTEGGLCSVERRAITDLCEFCGASKVVIVERSEGIDTAQAMALLQQ